MYVSTHRHSLRFPAGLRPALWLSLGLLFALCPRISQAQDLPPTITQQVPPITQQVPPPSQQGGPSVSRSSQPGGPTSDLGDAIEDGALFGEQFSGRSGEAYGLLGRAGVFTGPAVGRKGPIVPIEIMPYAFADNFMVFGSFRGFRAATDGWGMNLGGGARYYSPLLDRIFGANFYYDYDNSSGSLFRQTGFGFESLGAQWDARANFYAPFGTTDALLSTSLVNNSQHFIGHQMLYNNILTYGNALRGLDLELGAPVPGRVMRRHDVRVFGGWYTYNGKDVAGFNGWKGRVQANVIDSVNVQLEVFNDQIFKTTVVFGATWTYGGYRQPDDQPRTQFNRMTEMVRRNYNVVVAEIPVLQID
jgi:Inverse autotransporter, beta-domain